VQNFCQPRQSASLLSTSANVQYPTPNTNLSWQVELTIFQVSRMGKRTHTQ
jgi:hypothetical protein